LATSCVFADPAKKAGSIEFALKAVDLASDIGCERLRVFGGVIPEGISREQAVDDVAAALSEIAPRAEEKNVAVCIETHDDWSNPDYVAAVLRKVSSSAIAVNWDIMHPVRAAGKSIDEAFNTLKPWIKHCHIHDGVWEGEDKKLTLKPIGTGMVDHKRALELLSGIDYKSALSGEWINWADFPAEKHLPCEIATLKKYEKEISGKGR
jgi:sugar phosphate isomerase/epimerase